MCHRPRSTTRVISHEAWHDGCLKPTWTRPLGIRCRRINLPCAAAQMCACMHACVCMNGCV